MIVISISNYVTKEVSNNNGGEGSSKVTVKRKRN